MKFCFIFILFLVSVRPFQKKLLIFFYSYLLLLFVTAVYFSSSFHTSKWNSISFESLNCCRLNAIFVEKLSNFYSQMRHINDNYQFYDFIFMNHEYCDSFLGWLLSNQNKVSVSFFIEFIFYEKYFSHLLYLLDIVTNFYQRFSMKDERTHIICKYCGKYFNKMKKKTA